MARGGDISAGWVWQLGEGDDSARQYINADIGRANADDGGNL